MKKLTRIVPFFVALLLFSSVAPHVADAKEIENTEITPIIKHSDSEVVDEVFDLTTLEILKAIENIPEEELNKGPEAAKQWFDNNTSIHVTLDTNNDLIFNTGSKMMPYGAIGCATAIGVAIVGNVFSITKITKIKWAIEKLGGISKAAKEIVKWYDKYRQGGHSKTDAMYKAMDKVSEGLASDVKGALLDFLGITAVMSACFE